MNATDLPAVNATLNAISALLLVVGWFLIKARKRAAHKAVMLTACAVSALFLVSYLVYHYQVGSVRFTGQGVARTVYFTILISHTLLAVTVPVFAVLALVFAFRGRFQSHKKVTRWGLPIWLYVSVTGVVVYWMLYQMSW